MITLLFRSENGEIYLHREDDNPVWLMAEYACAAAVGPIHMQDYHEERSPACNSAINNQCTIFLFSIINAPSFFFRPLLSGPTIAYSCCVSGRGRYCKFWFWWCLLWHWHCWWGFWWKCWCLSKIISNFWYKQDQVSTMQKTGRANYSSLMVWSDLKRVAPMDVITIGQSTTILCVGFQYGDNQTYTWTTGWSYCKPALDQWEGSLLYYFLLLFLWDSILIIQRSYLRTWLNDKSVCCRKHQCVWFSLCVCLYLSVCVLRKWYKRRQWGGGYVRENSLETSFRNNSYILSPPIFLATIKLHFLTFRLWLFITTKFHEKHT